MIERSVTAVDVSVIVVLEKISDIQGNEWRRLSVTYARWMFLWPSRDKNASVVDLQHDVCNICVSRFSRWFQRVRKPCYRYLRWNDNWRGIIENYFRWWIQKIGATFSADLEIHSTDWNMDVKYRRSLDQAVRWIKLGIFFWTSLVCLINEGMR